MKCTVIAKPMKLQLTNILWCLMYAAGLLVVLFDIFYWRP